MIEDHPASPSQSALRRLGLASTDRAAEVADKVFEALGVRRARSVGLTDGVSCVYLRESGVAFWDDPSLINRLAEVTIDRKRAVLQSMSGEAHLFVWADPWEPIGAGMAMDDTPARAPHDPLAMPDFVTDVWMASTRDPASLLHYRRGGYWEILA
jgi:hypothetical protein